MPDLVRFDFRGHPVRITDADGEPWFLLTDLCLALGYKNPSKTAAMVREKYQSNIQLDSGGSPAIIVNEAGMNQLIMRSKKAEAEKFQDWVYEEVLPALRKTGRYTTPQVKDPDLQAVGKLLLATQAARDEAREARQLAEQSHAEAIQAKDMALQTLHAVSWLAVSQYVYLHHLGHQLPPADANAFGRFLTDYCLARNIPMGKWQPYGKQWGQENTYPVAVIERLLPQWLLHRSGQEPLTGFQIEEDGVRYGEETD